MNFAGSDWRKVRYERSMPSWEEIQEHVRNKYKLDDDEPNYFSLVWDYGNGRSQKVFVRRFNAFDMDWLEFRSAACPGDAMPHKVALRKNEELALGALALDSDNDYVVLYSAPLPTMDPDEFELPLRVVARIADDIEEQYTGEDDF